MRSLLIAVLLLVVVPAALAQEPGSIQISVVNAFQAEMTGGTETPFDQATFMVGDDVEYDGIIFDIDFSADAIQMTFDVSERAMMDPTGIVGPDTFERYYFTFDQPLLAGAAANPQAGLVPTVKVLSPTQLLVEISEGMELGAGLDAEIRLILGTVSMSARETGATVTTYNLGDIQVHTYSAPVEAFFNSTHIIESENSLVLVDPQFFLPFAMDFRAYADDLGKPIDRLYVSHDHPDHYAGLAAFADVPIYALQPTIDGIETNGAATLAERRAMMGEIVSDTVVVPSNLAETGPLTIDGVAYNVSLIADGEAATMLSLELPDYGVIIIQDTVYSGVHLILAGNPPTWIAALETLQANAFAYPIVLAGHGLPTTPQVYQTNIDWLMTAGELLSTVTTGEDFKAGLMTAFPELGMESAIDFALPFLFPQ